jgi:hypothetical protein
MSNIGHLIDSLAAAAECGRALSLKERTPPMQQIIALFANRQLNL